MSYFFFGASRITDVSDSERAEMECEEQKVAIWTVLTDLFFSLASEQIQESHVCLAKI